MSEVVRGLKAPSAQTAASIAAALTSRQADVATARTLAEQLAELNRFHRRQDAGQPTAAPAVVEQRWVSGVEFLLALDRAHQAFKGVVGAADLALAAKRAVHDSGLYERRERLLSCASLPVVTAAETAFRRLIAIRNVIRAGAELDSLDYHERYHLFADAVWSLRSALRVESGGLPLTPPLVGRVDWSGRAECHVCRGRAR